MLLYVYVSQKNYKRIALTLKMLFFLFGLSMYKDTFSDPINFIMIRNINNCHTLILQPLAQYHCYVFV